MPRKRKIQSVDMRDSLRVVTKNNFITLSGMENLSLKARKLLYIAISQVRKTDKEFYEFRITPLEFADKMGISVTHVYEEAERITEELIHLSLSYEEPEKKHFEKYTVFSNIACDINSDIVFKLNADMTDFLLGIKEKFSQPLLNDFVRMNSPYSIAIWHLMQREMKSKKPYASKVIEFDLMLDEIRAVTGTQETFIKLSDIKRFVLDKALREIKDNCDTDISYIDIKYGRVVKGFHFTAINPNTKRLLETNPTFIEEFEKKQRVMELMRSKNT